MPGSEMASTAPPDHAERLRIETDLQTTLLVEAAAGTGKTTCLIRRMVALLAEGRCTAGTLAAVTFTRKAAAEMRARYRAGLEDAAANAAGERRERLTAALDHIEQTFIGTIHAFCGRLLRERPVEAGVDVGFEELDEDAEYRLRGAAWNEYVAGLHADDSGLLGELAALDLELDRLREAYMAYANYPDVTRWPAERVTIDAQALAEARGALADLARHADGLELPRHANNDRLMPFYRDLPGRLRNTGDESELLDLLEDAARVKVVQKEWPGGQRQGREERDRFKVFVDTHAEPLVAQRRHARYEPAMRVLRGATALYKRLRAERGVLSFQDLLLKAAKLLRGKPNIRRYFRRRFSHLLVDEFQDTDPVQAQVMLLLTASDPNERNWRDCRPVDGALFVVGDPKQSIYRFRRADIVTYNQVRDIIDRCGDVVTLSANFRSLPLLIESFNLASGVLFGQEATDQSPADNPMQSARPGAEAGERDGVWVLDVAADRREEAELIARAVRQDLEHGLAPDDIMVVGYVRDALQVYAARLEAYGVPVEVTGGTAVNEVEEVQLLRSALAAVARPDDPVALVGCLRSALFGVSDTQLYRFARGGGQFRLFAPEGTQAFGGAEHVADALEALRRCAKWLGRLQPAAAVERMAVELGLFARGSVGGRAGGLATALELLRGVAGETWSVEDLAGYLDELVFRNHVKERRDALPVRPQGAAVRVMNLHQVKGLEAPVVYLADATGHWRDDVDLCIDRGADPVRGFLSVRAPSSAPWIPGPVLATPVGWEDAEAHEEGFLQAEHDRLLYVAATRAGRRLVICRPPTRRRWVKLIEAMGPSALEPAPQPAVAAPSRGAPAPQPGVFADALRERRKRITTATYQVSKLKEIAVRGSVRATEAPSGAEAERLAGEHGTEWGEVVHVVLEAAAQRPLAQLRGVAAAELDERGMDRGLADRVLHLVERVMASEIWRRGSAGARRLTEVPIQFRTQEHMTTIVRGVIDLVFLEGDRWVIVDYKTDDTAKRSIDALVAHYAPQVQAYADAWAALTGEPVAEAGLFFVHDGRYCTVPPGTTAAR